MVSSVSLSIYYVEPSDSLEVFFIFLLPKISDQIQKQRKDAKNIDVEEKIYKNSKNIFWLIFGSCFIVLMNDKQLVHFCILILIPLVK